MDYFLVLGCVVKISARVLYFPAMIMLFNYQMLLLSLEIEFVKWLLAWLWPCRVESWIFSIWWWISINFLSSSVVVGDELESDFYTVRNLYESSFKRSWRGSILIFLHQVIAILPKLFSYPVLAPTEFLCLYFCQFRPW